ncbi:MAG: hypothetical protein V4487_08515 [Chlamydiota bacterium]
MISLQELPRKPWVEILAKSVIVNHCEVKEIKISGVWSAQQEQSTLEKNYKSVIEIAEVLIRYLAQKRDLENQYLRTPWERLNCDYQRVDMPSEDKKKEGVQALTCKVHGVIQKIQGKEAALIEKLRYQCSGIAYFRQIKRLDLQQSIRNEKYLKAKIILNRLCQASDFSLSFFIEEKEYQFPDLPPKK